MPAKTTAAAAPSAATERIVTVNENGKSLRCRIVQTFRLADGSTAHQLQALDTGELMTITDDPAPPQAGGKGLAKRVFHWGPGNTVPPLGSPVPPQTTPPPELFTDPGVIQAKETAPPPGATTTQVAQAPATQTPATQTPATQTPVTQTPVTRTPATQTPVTQTPVTSASPYTVGELPAPSQPTTQAPRSVAPAAPARAPAAQAPAAQPPVVAAPGKAPAPVMSTPIGNCGNPCGTTCGTTCGPVCDTCCSPTLLDRLHGLFSRPHSSCCDTPACGPCYDSHPRGTLFSALGFGRSSASCCTQVGCMDTACGTTAKPVVAPATLPGPGKLVVPDPKTKVDATAPSTSTGMPPGASSVIAARNGLNGPVAYVPIQAMVMPKPWRPPLPPDPKVPEAPQLNNYVNAFSPPAPPKSAQQPTGGPMAMGAFTIPQSTPYGGMPYGGMPYGGMPYGGMPYGMPPSGMMNPYGPAPHAMNPYMMPQGMPYGYNPMMRTAMSDRVYQGPMPPDPFGTSQPQMMQPQMVQPVGYYPPMAYGYPQVPPTAMAPAGVQQVGFPPMAAPQAAPAPAPQVSQLIDLLHDSPYPAQREMAASYLATHDVRANPKIVAALIEGAKQDPAPTVRAGCVHSLMRLNVTSPDYRAVLEDMRTDADPRVREAAAQASGHIQLVSGTSR
jgi:hypothetical protein